MRKEILISRIFIVVMCLNAFGCREKKNSIKYEEGIFPESVMALEGLNSAYDDYNMDLDESFLTYDHPVVFSSNRGSAGGEFNLVYGSIYYSFSQMTGSFELEGLMTSDEFFSALTAKFNTDGNDFGPNRLFNSGDGCEYMIVSSEVESRGLDILFSFYTPYFNTVPAIPDPLPATLFNSTYDDAYLCFNSTLDTAYFCSNRNGDFDIYMLFRPAYTDLDTWLTGSAGSPAVADSINTSSDEKCPFIYGRYMVFASDMEGGEGGFDLYYSVFRSGKWSKPVNLGPEINSSSNEYRPVIGHDSQFTTPFLVFSSDRPGGKGGFDLYFTGISF